MYYLFISFSKHSEVSIDLKKKRVTFKHLKNVTFQYSNTYKKKNIYNILFTLNFSV